MEMNFAYGMMEVRANNIKVIAKVFEILFYIKKKYLTYETMVIEDFKKMKAKKKVPGYAFSKEVVFDGWGKGSYLTNIEAYLKAFEIVEKAIDNDRLDEKAKKKLRELKKYDFTIVYKYINVYDGCEKCIYYIDHEEGEDLYKCEIKNGADIKEYESELIDAIHKYNIGEFYDDEIRFEEHMDHLVDLLNQLPSDIADYFNILMINKNMREIPNITEREMKNIFGAMLYENIFNVNNL